MSKHTNTRTQARMHLNLNKCKFWYALCWRVHVLLLEPVFPEKKYFLILEQWTKLVAITRQSLFSGTQAALYILKQMGKNTTASPRSFAYILQQDFYTH